MQNDTGLIGGGNVHAQGGSRIQDLITLNG